MNLASILKLNLDERKVVIISVEETNIVDSDEQPYYLAKLKEPVKVFCSVEPDIEAVEHDEVYVRKAAILEEGWSFTDEKKPEEGFWREGWVVDFSVGQRIPIYQATTIKKWTKENRGVRRISRNTDINAGLLAKVKAKAEQKK